MSASEEHLLQMALPCFKKARLAAGILRHGDTVVPHIIEGIEFLEAMQLPPNRTKTDHAQNRT